MVFTMSLWGTKEGGMSWLDGSSGCKGSCEDLTNVSTTYSNIRIN